MLSEGATDHMGMFMLKTEITANFDPLSILMRVISFTCCYLFFEPVKVVNDDSNKQVQREEGSNNNENYKEEIRHETVLALRLLINLNKKKQRSALNCKTHINTNEALVSNHTEDIVKRVVDQVRAEVAHHDTP